MQILCRLSTGQDNALPTILHLRSSLSLAKSISAKLSLSSAFALAGGKMKMSIPALRMCVRSAMLRFHLPPSALFAPVSAPSLRRLSSSPSPKACMPLRDDAASIEPGSPDDPAILYRGNGAVYWDESFDWPQDPDPNGRYVFRPRLQYDARHKILHTGKALGPEGAACVDKLVRSGLSGAQQCALGNEGDDRWWPFVMPWDAGRSVTPAAILAELGAHPELQPVVAFRLVYPTAEQERRFLETGDDAAEDEEDRLADGAGAGEIHFWDVFPHAVAASEFRRLFAGADAGPLLFYAGSERLNPLPVFALGRLAPGEGPLGGFLSTVVHT